MNEDLMYQDEEDEAAGDQPRSESLNICSSTTNYLNRASSVLNNNNWPSSRIVRVSRASGGKDRHSKVLTSKGLRDRRVRLSVGTAIQFYDLQDRLGYDQPSKAVEWLLKAASSSIDELPPINSSLLFKQNDHQMMVISHDEKISSSKSDRHKSDQMDRGVSNNSTTENNYNKNNRMNNKGGSGLSVCRSEIRVRARERAKERAVHLLADQTKVDEKKEDNCNGNHDYSFHQLLNPSIHESRTTSFTELLSGAMNNTNNGIDHSNYNNQNRQWNHNYFGTHGGLMGQKNHVCNMKLITSENLNLEIHQHPSTSAFAQPDVIVQPESSCNENCNHTNFEISSSSSSYSGANISSSLGLNTGFNRGTLQSNSSSSLSQSNFVPQLLPHQRLTSSQDGFFLGSSMPPVELNHHRFLSGLDDARLQLFYGNNNAHMAGHGNHNVKGKN